MFGKKKKRLEISAPSNFEHRVHTGFDPREQKFTGLPQQWQSLLADTANRPKPMVDPSCITPIQLAPMKVDCGWTVGIRPEHWGQIVIIFFFLASLCGVGWGCCHVFLCVCPALICTLLCLYEFLFLQSLFLFYTGPIMFTLLSCPCILTV